MAAALGSTDLKRPVLLASAAVVVAGAAVAWFMR
jgi:hypothetical protein